MYDTDIAADALSVLANGVAEVSIVGRRGHVQGAFTIKELRELTKLEKEGFDTEFVVRLDELELGATQASLRELESKGGRPKQRINNLLNEAAVQGQGNAVKWRCSQHCACSTFVALIQVQAGVNRKE